RHRMPYRPEHANSGIAGLKSLEREGPDRVRAEEVSEGGAGRATLRKRTRLADGTFVPVVCSTGVTHPCHGGLQAARCSVVQVACRVPTTAARCRRGREGLLNP